MATLVKIADTVINLDLMTQAYFKPGSVRVYFGVATGKAGERSLDVAEFFGCDAVAFRAYLEQRSADVVEDFLPQEVS